MALVQKFRSDGAQQVCPSSPSTHPLCSNGNRRRQPRTHGKYASHTRPVQPRVAQTPCPTRLWTRFSHKPQTLHRGFQATCGRRGKLGPSCQPIRPVIQTSSNPQPRFRKPVTPSTPFPSIPSEGFPLFLPQLRGLLSFLLSIYPFPPLPVALPQAPAWQPEPKSPTPLEARLCSAQSCSSPLRVTATESRNRTPFPPPRPSRR